MAANSPELLRSMLRDMVRIRSFDERAEEYTMKGNVLGSVHLAIGQEAVAVGVCHALRPEDYVLGPHRGHHIALAKGLPADQMMAELMGRATGFCHGKGGHMHMVDVSRGLLGLNGIVAASIGIATGVGLSIKQRKSHQVAVAFFGDGGANKGQFHESMNLASILNLPVIYVCENNVYAVETNVAYATAVQDIAVRATSYNFPGIVVDGMDVVGVFEAAREARRRAVEDGRPTLIEAKTYRYKGHHTGDPERYRTKEEVAQWRSRDAIVRLQQQGLQQGWLTQAQVDGIYAEAVAEVEAAVQFGLASPEPEVAEAFRHVFAAEEV